MFGPNHQKQASKTNKRTDMGKRKTRKMLQAYFPARLSFVLGGIYP